MKITKDANESRNKYNGYGICFDSSSSFNFGSRIDAKNVIIFGVDMSFSSHKDTNGQNSIYVLGKGEIQGVSTTRHTTIYGEKMYIINFTEPNNKFVLSSHYHGDNSYLFVDGVEHFKLKKNISEVQKNLLCSGN